MTRCSQCDRELAAGAKFCGKCGAKAGPAAHFCARCGKALEEGKGFCGGCGAGAGGAVAGGSRVAAAAPRAVVAAMPAVGGSGGPVVIAPAAAAPAPSVAVRPRGGSGWKVVIVVLGMFFVAGGGAVVGVWYWKPWRLIWPVEEATIDKAAWDRDLAPAPDADAASRKARWTAEVNQRAQEVEAAFVAKNVPAILQLLPPPKRAEMRPLLEAKREELDRFGKVLATRKLVAVNEFIADFQVKDGKKTYPVTFALYDGKWYLYEF